MNRALCLSLSLLAFHLAWTPHAQAQMPCMVNGRACQLPGTSGLGNNMVPMPLGTFNSQYTGSERPSFGMGLGVTPKDGFIRLTGTDLQLIDGTGFTTSFYKSGGRYVSEFQNNGDQREIQVVGAKLTLTLADNSTITYGQPYQDRHFPIQANDPDGYQLFSASWINGLPVMQVNQIGGTTRFSSDKKGNVTSVNTPEGFTYTLSYNSSNQLVKVQAGDASTQYSYDAAGNVTEVKPPAGRSALYVYGKDNVLVGSGDGTTNTSIYYSNNSVTAETSSRGFTQFSTTTLAPYGRLYLPTKMEGGDGAARSGGSVFATFERDSLGNVTKYTDAAGNSTSYQLVKGLPVKMKSPDNTVLSLTRDANNKYRITSEAVFAPDASVISTTDYGWSSGKLTSITSKDPQGRILGSHTITRAGSSITTTSKQTEYYTYDTVVKGRLKGIDSAGFKGAVDFNSKGIPVKSVVNGVTTNLTRDISTNGHVKVTTTRGNLFALAESNFLGTKRNGSIGDIQGRFVSQSESSSGGTILNSTAARNWSVVTSTGSSRGSSTSAFSLVAPGNTKTTSTTLRGK